MLLMFPVTILMQLFNLVLIGAAVYLFILVVKALKRYIESGEIRKENSAIKRTLGETIKEYRMNRNMTQEFVAESLGVSRQAVSKWENGTSEPSTTNLIALAKLFGASVDEMLSKVK